MQIEIKKKTSIKFPKCLNSIIFFENLKNIEIIHFNNKEITINCVYYIIELIIIDYTTRI